MTVLIEAVFAETLSCEDGMSSRLNVRAEVVQVAIQAAGFREPRGSRGELWRRKTREFPIAATKLNEAVR
jgi:hypothetical protein